jgi:diguanylate cyclase (GGDEF)-like protein
MTITTSRRADMDLLMRSAEALLLAATDEARLLDVATECLGEQFGYGARYVVLHDAARHELYLGGAAGALADTPGVRNYRKPDGEGLSGASWRSGQIINVPDVRADPRYMHVLTTCRSEICVPIIAGDAVLGVLGVQSDQIGAFSEEDERLLAAYGRLLAMALMHARIHQARQKDIAELQAVSEIASRAVALDLEATLDLVCESFRRLTTSDSVAINLWDARTERLVAASVSYDQALYQPEYGARVREHRLRLGEGMIGWVAQHREALRIDDVAADPRPLAVKGTPLAAKSAIVIPLVVDDRLVGVVRAVKHGIASYTDDSYRLALTIASQTALMIATAEAHEEIRRLSVTDELTGAYNVRHVMQRLREEIELADRNQESVSMMVIDGDAMKTVNDLYGHAEGNRLLVELTDVMRSSLRISDVLGRFGGDEFVVVLPRTDPRDALIAAERLRYAVASHEFRNSWGEPIRATVSVGVSTYPGDGRTADELFREADGALYEAKQAGRNRVSAAA